ncbi:MAG: hypothetical protein KDD60_11490, partial [Bdellovibrionales bacterium]|nr:hypothetical protein [Bdellovibrionales bacterium]
MKKGIIRFIVSRIIVVALTLEVTIRLLGFHPIPNIQSPSLSLSLHPRLGWEYIPGTYKYKRGNKKKKTYTYWSDHSRATSLQEPKEEKPEILLFGDSVIHGYGLNDNETIAWQLQALLPDYTVRNFATDGGSHAISFLRMQEYLPSKSTPGSKIIFRWDSGLGERDVASYLWVFLMRKVQSMGNFYVPRAFLTPENQLTITPAEWQYRRIPLSNYSAFLTITEDLEFIFRAKGRENSKNVSPALLAKAKILAEERGYLFHPLILVEQDINLLEKLT